MGKETIDISVLNAIYEAIDKRVESILKNHNHSFLARGFVRGRSEDGIGFEVELSPWVINSNVMPSNGIAVDYNDEVIMLISNQKNLPNIIVSNLSKSSFSDLEISSWNNRYIDLDGTDPNIFVGDKFVTTHANCPTIDEAYYVETRFVGLDEFPTDRMQIAVTKNNATPRIYIRTCTDDVWTTWIEK